LGARCSFVRNTRSLGCARDFSSGLERPAKRLNFDFVRLAPLFARDDKLVKNALSPAAAILPREVCTRETFLKRLGSRNCAASGRGNTKPEVLGATMRRQLLGAAFLLTASLLAVGQDQSDINHD